jgi:hypothetical protein
VRITEGRLDERECPDCGGLERRAFGESESERGELASYAFGWTTGHEDRLGRLTIGIGAGNEGGGSFHAVVRSGEEGYAMGLVDEPFEDVPEGGPDLTREQALAHPDLKYVWWVADEAMAQDRRAWWMLHWLYGTAALATPPVVDGTEPVRHVARAEDDGAWQLLCGTVEADDPQVFHLHHAIDRDQSLLGVLDLKPGESAERKRFGRGWSRGSY